MDDLLIIGSSNKEIASLKDVIGIVELILGSQNCSIPTWNQSTLVKYDLDLLTKFNMKDCNPRNTPFLLGVKLEETGSSPMVNNTLYRQLIRCLIYLTHT